MATELRRILPSEGAALREIRIRALRDTPDAFGASLAETLETTADQWAQWASSSAAGTESVMIVAEAEGAWIGMAGGRRRGAAADAPAALISMWVAPEYRGQGLGRRLVEQIADWARAGGASRLDLCVTEGNSAAEALYARCGFTATGETEPLRSNPALTLRTMSRTM